DDVEDLSAPPLGGLLRGRVAQTQPPRPLRPLVRLLARHLAHQVATDEAGRVLRAAHEALGVQIDARQHGLLRAAIAEVAHERARVDALDGGDAVAREVGAERFLRSPRRRRLAVLAHHEAAHVGAARLDVLAVHADVPDLWVSYGDQMALVRLG